MRQPPKRKKARKKPLPDPTKPLHVPESLQDGYGFLIEIPTEILPTLTCPGCNSTLIRLKHYWACPDCLGGCKLLRDEVIEEAAMRELRYDKVKSDKLVKTLIRRSRFKVKFDNHARSMPNV